MLSPSKRPFVGILAFLVVLFIMPIGHAVMVLIEILFGKEYQYVAAVALGLIGVVFLFLGTKQEKETTATWMGFFAGILLWTGWVEFSYVYFAHHLAIAPLMEKGKVITKPEYLLMPSTIGLLFATFLYFFFNKETRCHFIKWFHRHLKLNLGAPTSSKNRNYAGITAMETIYIFWLFYVLLLIAYDPRLLGDRHPVTYAIFFGSLLWSLYLFVRLIKISKMPHAVRYAIPTVVIFWNSVEILARWGFFKEIWIHPGEYKLELSLIFAAFVGMTILTLLTPQEKPTESK